MNNNWEEKEFEECLDKVAYPTKIQRKDFLESGDFPIVSQEQDLINGYWNNSEDLVKVTKPIIIFGDHTQVLKFIEFDFVLGADGVKILKPIDRIESKFFFYCLQSVNLRSLGYARHFRLLKELKIPIPPLAEQKRIVAILDEAFSAISTAKENAEKNLKNAKELFDSYLNNIFEMKGKDWEEKKLGEVLQKTETINPTLEPDKEFVYIDVSSVNNETLTIENSSVIIGKSAPSRARKLVKTNDIIFATIRPTLKRIAIVSEEFHNQVCSTGYFVLRAKPFLNYQMLFYYLLTNKFDSQMEKLQKGASYPAVTDGDVRNQVIPFPPLKEQQRIVAKLDALSEQTKQLEAVYSKKIADLDELKKSILQKAFRGEL